MSATSNCPDKRQHENSTAAQRNAAVSPQLKGNELKTLRLSRPDINRRDVYQQSEDYHTVAERLQDPGGIFECSRGAEVDETPLFEEDAASFMLRRREFTFEALDRPVLIRQNFVGIIGTGGAVWRSSIHFARFVCSDKSAHWLPLAGKTVLELGSGLGLGAIAAWFKGADKVVATDVGCENGPLNLLKFNIAANCSSASCCPPSSENKYAGLSGSNVSSVSGPAHIGGVSGSRSPPMVQELTWGQKDQLDDALKAFDGFAPDVVFACDVVFDESILPALLQTLVEVSSLFTRTGKHPRLCISHQRRDPRREDQFFRTLSKLLPCFEWREIHRAGDLSINLFDCIKGTGARVL